jgi:YbbR domain-containing protein
VKTRLKELQRNWTLKVFSLMISILLFLFVSVESSTVIDVEYAIDYRTADDIMLTSPAPRKLTATLKGPWATFRTFGNLETVVIDLSTAEPGTLRHRIDVSDVAPPTGMKVMSIRPSEIELGLDRRVEKLVSVEVDPLGRPAFGFDIVEIRVDPPRVRVEGPMSKIRVLDFVHTRPINLRDRTEDLTVEAELRPPTPPLRLVDRTAVSVFVDITEDVTSRDLNLPVVLVNAPSGATATPDIVEVELKGPRHVVDRLGQDALQAVIDVSPEASLGETKFEKTVSIRPELPERTVVVGALPSVMVTLPGRRR